MNEEKGIIPVIPTSKESVLITAEHLIKGLEEGDIHPFDLILLRKSIETLFESIKGTLNDLAVSEAEKYGKDGVYHKGIVIKVGEFGTRYNYKGTGDPVWTRLSEDLKAREEWLRSLKGPETVVDTVTGEEVVVYPPAKSSTTSTSSQFK